MAADATHPPHPLARPSDPNMTAASDLVVRAVARLCGPDEAVRVLAALRACSATAPSAERDRVQLAVLKLWDEDSAHDLDTWARAAETDYRDVLYWAESPGEAGAGDRARLSSAQLQALRAADRDQLAAWLERVA